MAAVSGHERLRIEARLAPDRVVIALQGELDLASAPQLASAIERAESQARETLVLDLGELDFIDSAGLRVILAAHERAQDTGREFAVTPGTPQVRRLFTVAGVSGHLHTIAQPDAVLAAEGDRGSAEPG
jgi:anti-sigma B factor antagonist